MYVAFAIIIFIVGNVIFYRLIVYNAKRNYIIPDLEERGYVLLTSKFASIFSNHQFKKEEFPLTPVMMGNPFIDIYIMIEVFSEEKQILEKLYVRISTVFLVIKGVVYDRELS